MANSATIPQPGAVAARIQTLTLDHPWSWLAKGWHDLQARPALSLGYGMLFAAVGVLLLILLLAADLFYLFLPLASGFLLVGPIAAVGLYAISRAYERGEAITWRQAVTAWRRNGSQIAGFGMVLMLLFVAWVRLATLVYALMSRGVTPNWERFVSGAFLTPEGFPLLLVLVLLGGAMAALVFSISVVAVPLLLDRPVNALDAMRFSMAAMRRNPVVMLLWASLVAGAVALGFATLMLGLIVLLPLVGHASWHAYRDIVGSATVVNPV